jgi:hypothetical protein
MKTKLLSREYDYLVIIGSSDLAIERRYVWSSSLRDCKSVVHGLKCRWSIIGPNKGELLWFSPEYGLTCGSNLRFLSRFKKTGSSKRAKATDTKATIYLGIDGKYHIGQAYDQSAADNAACDHLALTGYSAD